MVHRDVKPSNVILDNSGKPWVTDFGLARIETDATLRKRRPVGHGPLHEPGAGPGQADRGRPPHRRLLAGRDALRAVDAPAGLQRPGSAELIAADRLRGRQTPRQLNKAIPEELEIIVLKAMAKNPAERYDTAQELADDLRRFLEDRPIEARRPRPTGGRCSGCGATAPCRRRRPECWSCWWLSWRRARHSSGRNARPRRPPFAPPTPVRNKPAGRLPAHPVGRGSGGVDQVGEAKLEPAPGLDQVRARMLREALEFYSEACDRRPDDLALRAKLGRICRFRARFLKRTDRVDQAEAAFVKAIAILDEVVASSATSPRAEADLVESHAGLGQLLGLAQHRRQEAFPHFELAIARQSAIFARDPMPRIERG